MLFNGAGTWAITLYIPLLAALLASGVYLALRVRRRKNGLPLGDSGTNCRPSISLTHMDGWASLAILLLNNSDGKVWAEEVEIILPDLIANEQVSEASCRGILKIRQAIPALGVVAVSHIETISKAAGEPQRRHSCLLSSIVRFSVVEGSFEETMQPE